MNRQLSKTESLLSKITFITSTGDFISLFVFLKLLEQTSGSIYIASFSIGIRALGSAIASLSFGPLLSRFSIEALVRNTQILAGLTSLVCALTLAQYGSETSTLLVSIFYLVITVLNQWFSISRDAFADSLGEHHEKRSIISSLMKGSFGAQVVGSILGFVLISSLPIYAPVAIDGLSFLIAGFLCLKLEKAPKHAKYVPFAGWNAVLKSQPLKSIFMIRSIWFWIPITLFNFFRFNFITEGLGLDSIHSVWIDVTLGAGGFWAAQMMARGRFKLGKLMDYQIAVLALSLSGISRFILVDTHTLYTALPIIVFFGVFSSLNAIATRSIRAKTTEDVKTLRSNIISLEMIVSQLVIFIVSLFCVTLGETVGLNYKMGFVLSGVLQIVCAVVCMDKRIRV